MKKTTKNISLLFLVAACMGIAHPMDQKTLELKKQNETNAKVQTTVESDYYTNVYIESVMLEFISAMIHSDELHNAATSGNFEWGNALLARADVNSKRDESTALHKAAANGYKDIVKYLISMKADPTATDNNGKKPRDLVIFNPSDEINDAYFDKLACRTILKKAEEKWTKNLSGKSKKK